MNLEGIYVKLKELNIEKKIPPSVIYVGSKTMKLTEVESRMVIPIGGK